MPETTSQSQPVLADRRCVPCRGGTRPLAGEDLAGFQRQIPDWDTIEGRKIARTFGFPDFVKALDFVNLIGDLAEQQGHHPDIFLTWGKVRVELWTHKIGGLSEGDFVMAAKIDRLRAAGDKKAGGSELPGGKTAQPSPAK